MLIGIEETTDARHPEVLIKKFTSERKAREWLAGGGGLAWPGAADPRLPTTQQNFHRRVRVLLLMPHGYRLPIAKIKRRWWVDTGSRGLNSFIADQYYRVAEEILRDTKGRPGSF